MFKKYSSHQEELANTITHGIGVLLSIVGLVYLVQWAIEAQDVRKIISFSVFGTALILLYSASTIYHAVRTPKAKHLFHIIDHMAIYVLIAGSYTPFTLVTLKGAWGWSLFGIVWAIALFGIIYKIFFIGKYKRFSLILYICMGWIALIAAKPLIENLPMEAIIWIVAGGITYSLGVIFFVWKNLPFSHAIWHLFVLGGSICHFFAIGWYV